MTLSELKNLVESLGYGKKREIARRMRVNPGAVSNALDGFVKSREFMERLEAVALELRTESHLAIS